jgi:RNase P subunit RPR2
MRRTSGRVMLICEECGETLVLGEPEEVWLSTRTRFECECGEDVSLASRREKPLLQQSATRDRSGRGFLPPSFA